jgi:beta-mannanase
MNQEFISWNNYVGTPVFNFITQLAAINRWALITIQPYHDVSLASAKGLLLDVINGKYDSVIQQMATEINMANRQVFLRRGQEMELSQNIGRYDWDTTNAPNFVGAFRYFVTRLRSFIRAFLP